MEKSPQFVKEFSKEYSSEERQKIAEEIRNKRIEYFKQKEETFKNIKELTLKAVEKEKGTAEVVSEIKDIEISLAERKKSKILQILNYFEIKKLQKEARSKLMAKKQFEEEYQTVQNLLEPLKYQIQEKKQLEKTKRILSDFYKNQEAKWQAYEKEKIVRNVANIAEQYQTIFVHGINPTFVPGANSLLEKDTDWQTKLKILLSLEPTISASTIKEGDTHRNMWSRMGVILNNGSVLNASPTDMGTVAKGIKKRLTGGQTITGKIEEDIKIAITSKRGGYNELVVEEPKIAGFYICLDDTGHMIKNDLVSNKEIALTAKEFGLPLYVIQHGTAYEADYDLESKSIIKKEKLSHSRLIQKQFQISELQKEKITEELFADSPFNIKSPEMQYIDSRNQGKETYIEINVPKNPADFAGEYKEIGGVQLKLVAELQRIGEKDLYYLKDEKLIERREYKNGRIWERYVNKFDEYEAGCIQIGFNTHNLKRAINTNEDYISGMEKSAEEMIDEYKKIRGNEEYEGQTEFYDEWLNKLAFHLYGFGEQAGQFSDTKSQEKVFELASQIMPREKYQEILRRRTDEQGRFRITTEDLV